MRAAEGGKAKGAGEELWEWAEAACAGAETADGNPRREGMVTRAMTPFGVITIASWKHQFSGKKDNKGENARINSERAREQCREQPQPASLLHGAPSLPFSKATLSIQKRCG